MSTVRIVTQPMPNTTQRVQLSGVTYSIRLLWSQRGSCWHMDLSDGDGELLLGGLRVVTHIPLLAPHRYLEGLPPGDLMLVDVRGVVGGKPTLEDMGTRFRLYYFEPVTSVAEGA